MSAQSIESEPSAADRVSRDTIMKLEFLSGAPRETLKDVTLVMMVNDRIVEIDYDSEGRMNVRPARD